MKWRVAIGELTLANVLFGRGAPTPNNAVRDLQFNKN